MRVKDRSQFCVLLAILGGAVFLAMGPVDCPPPGATFSAIEVGWDLFEISDVRLKLDEQVAVQFEPVPIGSFDFGGEVGIRNTGTAHIVLRRPHTATALEQGDTHIIPVEVKALQLRSIGEIDVDGDGPIEPGVVFVTLTSATETDIGGGKMTVQFMAESEGTFDAELQLALDFRREGPEGNLLRREVRTFIAEAVPWQREPAGNAVQIEAVNVFLNGRNTQEDFWAPNVNFITANAANANDRFRLAPRAQNADDDSQLSLVTAQSGHDQGGGSN